ncbi:MAG: HlyD family efflux transporter periplasmic adaptor subunit [Aureliella sp.]
MSLDHIIAAEHRPMGFRRRADLQLERVSNQGEIGWVAKDPIALKYHRLTEPEMLIWRALHTDSTLADLHALMQSRYPTRKARFQDLQFFLSHLHRSGLIVADNESQASQLLFRKRRSARQKWKQRLASPLSIKLPGVDPEPLLRKLTPVFGWTFSRGFLCVWLAVFLSASLLTLTNASEFRARLPEFQQFFSAHNFVWLLVITSVVKVLHELAHGVACKRYGGECHEIGLMFLVFTPTLYCDTSDSWLLTNKWRRITVNAAGMLMEVGLASLATFCWWYTQPGLLHYASLNVMFVCSVSTVIFNANPLLRYDGYYIASDWLEIPNLTAKSKAALISVLRVLCLGMKPISQRHLPERGLFLFSAYSVASFIYKWLLLGTIMWFLFKVFEPRGLESIGYTLIALTVATTVGVPVWQVMKYFRTPGRLKEVKRKRLGITAGAAMAFLSVFFLVPLPDHVYSPAVIRPSRSQNLYVTKPGRLTHSPVQYGQRVNAGDLIATLKDPELEVEFVLAEAELNRQEALLAGYEVRQGSDAEIASQIPQTQAAISELNDRVAKLEAEIQSLQLLAPISGVLMPPPSKPREGWVEPEQQLVWQDLPLKTENAGATLAADTLVGLVGSPSEPRVHLFVPQHEVGRVRVGQRVQLILDEMRGSRLKGCVMEISKAPAREVPPELSVASGGPLLVDTEATDTTGRLRPALVHYEVLVAIQPTDESLLQGFRGQAKIRVENASMATQIARGIGNLINFR